MWIRAVGAQGLAPLRWISATAIVVGSTATGLGYGNDSAVAAPVDAQFGDVNCSAMVDSVDAIWVLRFAAGFPQPQGEGACPFWGLGHTVSIDGAPRIWGDNDCGGSINAVDALKTLRHAANLNVTQSDPCPDIATLVQVVAQ